MRAMELLHVRCYGACAGKLQPCKGSVCTERHAQQSVRCVWRVEVEAGHVMGAKGRVQICEEGYVWRKVKKKKTDLGNRLGG